MSVRDVSHLLRVVAPFTCAADTRSQMKLAWATIENRLGLDC